jgi:hypothetical protein
VGIRIMFETSWGYQDEMYAELTSITPRDTAAVPEPATLIMLGTGLLGVATVKRRRR